MLKLNLLPREYILGRKQRRASLLVGGAFAATLAVLIGTALVRRGEGRELEEVRARLAESRGEAAALVERLERANTQVTEALRNANRHAALLDRVPVSCVLALVASALPEQASLTTFDMDFAPASAKSKASARKPPGADAAGDAAPPANRQALRQRVSVGGTAATDVEVANFMANLSHNALIERVELVQSHEKLVEDQAVREFLVEIELKPNADALDLQGAAKAGIAHRAPPADHAERSEGT